MKRRGEAAKNAAVGNQASASLEIAGLRSGYGGSAVLQGVDLTVRPGEVVALLGRNGVGKTTLISTIMGWVHPRQGSVRVDGTELAGLSTERIARLGVATVPQGRRVFAPLSVEMNLKIVPSRRRDNAWSLERVYDVMPRLAERRRNRGDQLSGGEQQMLAIARALMLGPRVLLMDEPSDGLAPAIIDQVMDIVAELKTDGLTTLIVEQNLGAAFRVADRILVMQKGLIVHDSSTLDFRSDEARATRLLGVQ